MLGYQRVYQSQAKRARTTGANQNVKNAGLGALPEHFNSDKNVFVLNEGRPDAYFIIVPKEHQHANGMP